MSTTITPPTTHSAIAALLPTLQDNQARALNPANPTDEAAIQLFMQMSNRDANTHPGVHGALNTVKANSALMASAPAAHPSIVDIGKNANGLATSTSCVSVPGLPMMTGVVTLVLNADTDEVLASGSATTLGEGLTQVSTNPSTAQPASARETALTIYYTIDQQGSTPHFGAIKRTVTLVAAAPQAKPMLLGAMKLGATLPEIDAPRILISGHTLIRIGLARDGQGQNPDCDYSFTAQAGSNTPNLLVPFAGSYALPANITGVPPQGGQIPGLEIDTKLFVPLSQSVMSTLITPMDQVLAGCTVQGGAPNVIHWSFPASNPVNPLAYTPAVGAQDSKSVFYFQFSVPCDDPQSPCVFTICSVDMPDPSTQCFQIPDLQFTWHCVAEGTLVTLADGSKLPIEQATNQVRAGNGVGGSLAVEATWKGQHEGDAIKLTTANGHSLTLTQQHVVQSSEGLIAAEHLAPGHKVLTEDHGYVALTQVEKVPAKGYFWNLFLGDADDRAAGRGMGPSCYVANGIVVGDFQAQGAQYRATRQSLDYMIAHVPAEFHKDYHSTIRALAAR